MAPSIWFHLGKILFNAGKVAMHWACCCDDPVQDTCCCPGTEIPNNLTATITDKTGDCVCLPDTVPLVYLGSDPMSGLVGQWFGLYDECDGGGCSVDLQCRDDGEGCYWTLGPASCAVLSIFNDGESSCDPLVLVFDVDNSIGGSTNCSGSFKVTITI